MMTIQKIIPEKFPPTLEYLTFHYTARGNENALRFCLAFNQNISTFFSTLTDIYIAIADNCLVVNVEKRKNNPGSSETIGIM